jgi:hypothetical protein
MINKRHKEIFWTVVEACLEAFHHVPTAQAHAKTKAIRMAIEQAPPGVTGNSIYHAEPFDVACDLAGNSLDLHSNRQEYESILKLYGSDFAPHPP